MSGLANDATPTITLSASSAPASLSASHALPVGDIVNFNDRGDAGGYTYGLTGATLDRGVLPTIHYISLETVNLNTALAASTINVMNTTANANTTVTGSVNATPTTDAFNITSTGANGNATFVAGTGDTAFNLQTTGTGSFTRILGKGGNDTVLVSSNSIAGMRGNMDSILGTLAIDAGAGNNNRLAFDNFTGVPIAAAVIYNDAITGLAPANIFYAATGGHFLDLNPGTLDGIRVFGSNAGSDTFNVRSTLAGSTTLIEGEGANDTFNVSSDAGANLGTLAGILGHLTLQGGAGSANRLTISDSGNTDSAAARSNVIQTTIDIAGTQFQQLRNFAGTVAGGVGTVTINYTATGGAFTHGSLEDGVLLIGSNTLSSTFNVRTTLGGSTTKILGGTAADYIVVSSTANTTGDPGTSIANGTLNGIAGNLTLDAGGSTSNRLIVSDSAQTLAPKNHVIQGETTIGGVTYEQVQNLAAGLIQYVASGGGFNHGALEDGVLIAGSSTLSSTFNVRTALGGSTTKILGGTAADNVIVSSTANTTGDPGFAAVANGTLDGIAGNLTLDAGGNTANRLIVSDSAQIATPKSNVLQTETSIGGSVYEKIQNFATGLIQYVASGGGFNHVAGPTDFADGIRLQGSLATSTAFTFRNTLGGSSLMAYGGSASDNFFVGSPPPNGSLPSNLADSGDLNLIRGQIAVVGNGGSDALVVNDAANGSTANKSNAFNYTVTPNRIVNDPTPVKTVPSVTIPPARTFAANGVIYNASGNAAQNSVTTLRVDGSGDANIFSVTPSRLTTYTIDGNLPASGVPIPGGGDYLKLDTTHFSDRIGGRKLHIDSVGNGFWSFDGSTATQPVNFLSFERFNHVDVTATVESLPNQSPVITVRDSETGEIKYQVQPYPGIAGGASVAVGDLNFDGLPDLAVSPGANLAANVTIFNGTPDANGNYGHAQLASFPAFASAFRTGVSLGIGDLNADGANELVVGAGSGSGGGYQPTVQVFDGQTILNGTPSAAPPQLPGAPFLAFEPSFTGGVNISIGDLNNDGREDILATRQTGTATVNVFSYPASAFTLARSFMAFTPAVNGGLTNAVGDYDGDGWNDILLGSGPGGSPGVMVYQGGASLFGGSTAAPGLLQMFAPSPSAFTGGVLVQATPVNGGDPGTIERTFITAKLQGTSTIATYAAPPGESLPASIQQVLPAGNPSPATLIGVPNYAVGADIGGSGTVSVYTPAGAKINTFNPFPGATGGVRTAVGDFNNDGTPDIAMGSGPGIVAHVKIYDGANGNLLFDVQPFEDFTGGVFVAAGDITGDGRADLIITPDLSGGPRVTVYRGGDFQRVANFFGIDDPNFRGGARAGVGDINGDGFSDLVVSAGFGGGPRLSIYDGKSLTSGLFNHLVPDFFLFETSLRNGVYVAVGDANGDGYADIVGGAGPGGGPRVLVLSGKTLMNGGAEEAIRSPVANFFGGDSGNRGGIRVAVKNLDGDPYADLLTGSGQSGGSRVTGYLGMELAVGGLSDAMNFDAFTGFSGGVFVG